MDQIIASTYRIIQKIGAGGGGVVYLAEHLRLGKNVVLKVDKRKLTTKPELLRKEVDVLKELKHAYIPRVYDFFVEGETVCTVMDYIEGESLDKALKRGERFSQPQVIRWAVQLLDALDYLHSPTHGTPPKGYVHSDIKPANLMRMPDNNICLIDFNIALSLGETHVIGASIGYASPEHYGRDFSFSSSQMYETDTAAYEAGGAEKPKEPEKEPTGEVKTSSMSALRASPFGKKTIIPDVRSDIYSVGATLYHLLSGKRPAKEATDVMALSKGEYSPPLVEIITKAMNPNPDLRYQTAREMQEAFLNLRKNDPRMKSWKRKRKTACVAFPILIAASAVTAFVGLKRLQVADNWLKHTEYARNAMEQGDMAEARRNIRQALPEKSSFLTPALKTETQRVLTDVLGVYDMKNSYRTQGIIELPSEVLGLEIAPDGRTGAGLCSGNLEIFNIEEEKILTELPTDSSALSEVKYLDESTILYAGRDGICCFDIAEGRELWTGEPATKICVSSDGKTAAAVYRDETGACLYDTENGNLIQKLDFGGKHQSVAENDSFANPGYSLLALSPDGRFLAVSFDDGTLTVYDLQDENKPYYILKDPSDYYRFEGGFSGQYLAFTATSPSESVFVVVDANRMEQTGGARTDNSTIEARADDTGIYIKSDNILAAVDPVTGDQTPLVTTAETILEFDTTGKNTVMTTDDAVQFYDYTASLMSEFKKENTKSFLALAENAALIGSLDSPVVRIMDYEEHPEAEIFSYDPSCKHDEARISADGKTMMLFSYDTFYLYDIDGNMQKEVSLPDAEQIYDQQFVRDEEGSRLEVIYNDGKRTAYDVKDGALLYEKEGDPPDLSMEEEFVTDRFRIRSALHGQPEVYNLKTDKLVCTLTEDAYLTYVTQADDDAVIVQYVTADGYCYGQLMNEKWEVLADLPYLCDVIDGTLLFDYPDGNVCQSHIYRIDQLKEILKEEERNA